VFEKVQSLPENNGNSWLMTAACHALISRPFVCPWSCSRCLEPDLQQSRSFGLARTPASRHATWARGGRTPARWPACPAGQGTDPSQPPAAPGHPQRAAQGAGAMAEGGGSRVSSAQGTPGASREQQHGARQLLLIPGPGSPHPAALHLLSSPSTGSPQPYDRGMVRVGRDLEARLVPNPMFLTCLHRNNSLKEAPRGQGPHSPPGQELLRAPKYRTSAAPPRRALLSHRIIEGFGLEVTL